MIQKTTVKQRVYWPTEGRQAGSACVRGTFRTRSAPATHWYRSGIRWGATTKGHSPVTSRSHLYDAKATITAGSKSNRGQLSRPMKRHKKARPTRDGPSRSPNGAHAGIKLARPKSIDRLAQEGVLDLPTLTNTSPALACAGLCSLRRPTLIYADLRGRTLPCVGVRWRTLINADTSAGTLINADTSAAYHRPQEEFTFPYSGSSPRCP